MGSGAVQTPTLAPEFKTIYERQLLKNARNNLYHQRFGRKRTLKGGKTIEIRRATPLAPITTAMTEGVIPNAITFEVTSFNETALQYGTFIKGTDVVTAVAFDPLLSLISEELGAQAGESIDIVCRDVLAGGGTLQLAGGKSARNLIAGTDVLNAAELLKARTTLGVKNTPTRSGGDYDALVHPVPAADLMRDPSIAAAFNAGDHRSEMYDGSIGRFMGIKFWQTPLGKVFLGAGAGGTVNVYVTFVFGINAYAVLDIDSLGLQMIYHGKGSAGHTDPLDQFWSSGWKTSFGCYVERSEYMVRIEHAATNG